jgi:hypothetical protein
MRTEVEWRCLRTSAVETEVVVTIGILQRELGAMQTRAGGNEKSHFFGRTFLDAGRGAICWSV